MSNFQLTKEAEVDILEIARFTISKFGINQARIYKKGLTDCFDLLFENVNLGRKAENLAPDLKRFRFKSHVIFYRASGHGILIIRVLHQHMDFESHL